MDVFSAIVLGLVQAFTEFLPVSSSGHLVLGPAQSLGLVALFEDHGVCVLEVMLLVRARSNVWRLAVERSASCTGERSSRLALYTTEAKVLFHTG